MGSKGNLLDRALLIGKLLMVAALLLTPGAHAAAGNTALKIYELDGAGALSGSTYRQDTIILFNPTQATINCTTCAIQTHSGTSNTAAWTVYKLPTLAIPAGGFYMIAASSPTLSTTGAIAPILYDYRLKTIEGTIVDGTSGDNILSSTVGVVALTNTQTALTSSSSAQCGTGTQLVDLVAYGSTVATNSATTATPASCYAGSGAAYYDGSTAYGRQMGVTRKNKCIDTFDNLKDFVNLPPSYFNSSSAPSVCPTGTQLSAVISVSPNTAAVGGPVTFQAVVTPSTSPTGSGITSVVDANSPYFGGTTLTMYDDGTHGDLVAGDGTYSLTVTVPATVVSGFTYPVNVTVTDSLGGSYTGATPLAVGGTFVSPSAGNNSIRIIAWYGAGDLAKSEYGRDTVILFNPTQAPIMMNNWSLQTGGTTGAFTTVNYLLPVVTIPAGGYFAIAGSGPNYISTTGGCSSAHCNLNYAYDYQLKTLEGTATSIDNDLTSAAVTVALVNNQVPLGTCPAISANLVDLVGIAASDGSAPVTCYAGSGPALYTPATTNGVATNINGLTYAYATVRKNKCANTYDNANDFMLGFIDFANSTTTPAPCPTGTQLAVATAVATPNSPGILDPFTITTNITPATVPTSTGLTVTADLSNLGAFRDLGPLRRWHARRRSCRRPHVHSRNRRGQWKHWCGSGLDHHCDGCAGKYRAQPASAVAYGRFVHYDFAHHCGHRCGGRGAHLPRHDYGCAWVWRGSEYHLRGLAEHEHAGSADQHAVRLYSARGNAERQRHLDLLACHRYGYDVHGRCYSRIVEARMHRHSLHRPADGGCVAAQAFRGDRAGRPGHIVDAQHYRVQHERRAGNTSAAPGVYTYTVHGNGLEHRQRPQLAYLHDHGEVSRSESCSRTSGRRCKCKVIFARLMFVSQALGWPQWPAQCLPGVGSLSRRRPRITAHPIRCRDKFLQAATTCPAATVKIYETQPTGVAANGSYTGSAKLLATVTANPTGGWTATGITCSSPDQLYVTAQAGVPYPSGQNSTTLANNPNSLMMTAIGTAPFLRRRRSRTT